MELGVNVVSGVAGVHTLAGGWEGSSGDDGGSWLWCGMFCHSAWANPGSEDWCVNRA